MTDINLGKKTHGHLKILQRYVPPCARNNPPSLLSLWCANMNKAKKQWETLG